MWLGIRLGKENETQEDYFKGGRTFKWWAIGLSVIATQVSAITFIGAPGWAYQEGLVSLVLNLNIPLVMWFIGGVLAPFFYNSGVTSVYEYLEVRFGSVIRSLMAGAFIFKMLMVVGTLVYAPSLVLASTTPLTLNITIAIITVISIIYTISGGIKAVIWTDVIQMLILWAGLIVSFIVVVRSVPYGFTEILAMAKDAGKLTALNFSSDLTISNTVWAGLMGGTILHLAYFGVDQAQVQRILTAKSMKNVKYSLWFSGVVALFQMFIFLLMGSILYIYFEGKAFTNPNNVFIEFAINKLPSGVLGLIVAAIFASAMSSIDSALNSISTVFVKDIYEKWINPKAKNNQSLRISRIVTLIWGIFIAGFAFLVSNTNLSILEAISKYGSYLLGSMFGVFILGFYSKKANQTGSSIGLIAGVFTVSYVAQNTSVFWMWNNLIGVTVTLILGYLISILTGGENKEVDRYTIQGQKKYFADNNIKVKEDKMYIMPGKFEKISYALIVYFVAAFIFLYVLGS